MPESRLRLYFISLLLLSCVSSSSSSSFSFQNPVVGLVACLPHKIQAFTQFKNEFDTRHCNHSDSFNGIWCDNSTGAVTKLCLRGCLSGILKSNSSLFEFHQLRYLDLSDNNFISSSLPSRLGNLNSLEVFSLYSNGFLGHVPSSFSNLSLLTYLDLYQNELTGSFPRLRNLTKLSLLDLSYNHFSGTLSPNSNLFELNQLRYLDLGNNNFSSSLPSEFGNLHRLEILKLTTNGFFGQVPLTISNLTQLTLLQLTENNLTGSFPLVQNLTKLSVLKLDTNNFFGNIPSSLFTMPSLTSLVLSGNHLTCSKWNSSTSSSLKVLALGENLFKRQILEPISKIITLEKLELSHLNTRHQIDISLLSSLKSLLQLELSGNNISPTSLSFPLTLERLGLNNCSIREFPNILKSLENLEYIIMNRNEIRGKVPEWFWKLPRLRMVDISHNYFNGFEGSMGALVNSPVEILVMSFNEFEGTLPHLPLSITALFAMVNSFTGEIPLSICNRSSLSMIGLSNNNLTGSIPQCLSNMTVLNLRMNNLEGSIPDEFYIGSSLWALDVGFNRLSGKLPKSLVNCSSLQFLNIKNNRIKDTFPSWLKALPNLQVLILSSNQFYGPVTPPDHGRPLGFRELRILEISDNQFTGSLPTSYFDNWKQVNEDSTGLYMVSVIHSSLVTYQYSYLIDLQYKGLHMEQQRVVTFFSAIDFSLNKFEGHIPDSIGFLKGLIALNLSNNAFTGHIPSSFTNLVNLESLDLSKNQLSGTIPHGLGTLSFLAYVNVSYNQLEGEIPQGTQITGQSESSFEGNAGLCGLPLKESCHGTNEPPTQRVMEEEDEEQVLNWKGVVIGFGFGLILGLAIAQVIASCKPLWLVKFIGLAKRRNR